MPQFSQLWGDDLTTELGTNDTSVLFTDARRKHAINQGYRQFADLTECFVKRSSVTVSSSAQEFNLNSTTYLTAGDFLRLASEGPTYIKTDTAGNQQIYAGDDFPQRAIPFAVSTNYRHDLYPYHQGLVHYAAHQMEKLRRDDERADKQMRMFLGYVERYLQAKRKKGSNGVRASRSYFRNAQRRGSEGGLLAPWWR